METVHSPKDGLPSLVFDGKKVILNGMDITRGVVGINVDLTANEVPTAVITLRCSSIDVKTHD